MRKTIRQVDEDDFLLVMRYGWTLRSAPANRMFPDSARPPETAYFQRPVCQAYGLGPAGAA